MFKNTLFFCFVFQRNMNEYFNAVKPTEMMTIFASLLHERRIVVTSSRLSRLTACVQAVNTLLYPMSWQHIFIPVLHKKLIDYLSAPMPFLIGVPLPLMKVNSYFDFSGILKTFIQPLNMHTEVSRN